MTTTARSIACPMAMEKQPVVDAIVQTSGAGGVFALGFLIGTRSQSAEGSNACIFCVRRAVGFNAICECRYAARTSGRVSCLSRREGPIGKSRDSFPRRSATEFRPRAALHVSRKAADRRCHERDGER